MDHSEVMKQEIAKTGVNAGVVPPHVQRMLDEREQLSARCASLTNFFSTSLFASLDAEDQRLLKEQIPHMQAYLDVLDTRIGRANVPA